MNVKLKMMFSILTVFLLVFSMACGSTTTSTEQGQSDTESDESTNAEETPSETSEQSESAAEESEEKGVIKIGVLASLTGPLEVYGNQTLRGLEMGFDYATNGTGEVAGKKIEIVYEDTETKPDIAVQKATRLLEDEGVDIIVGSTSSGDTLAVLPIMEEYEKVMIVEPAVADSITGANWNKYIFRTARNSSQDAVTAAQAIAGDVSEGVKVATLAPDYAFGHDGVSAFKTAAESLGAEVILEEYADPTAVDFTSNIQRILDADPDYLFIVWAGANTPFNQIADMKVQESGIQISTGVPDIGALYGLESIIGMKGFAVYHHSLPSNEVNDWLVEEHQKRFDGEYPDLFTPGGMSAAIAIVEALEKTNGDTNGDVLVETLEGMSFETPKGTMTFRAEDHQAMQTMYSVSLEKVDGYDYPVPVLIKELSPEDTAPPIKN
ncbi:substrate-binding domain-containing protein [Chengkuizengella axinellae]|uniref:Substrate-binding domain-containing protein n=1 Tax=Chengkuizengella axinellae TaxID=3064388 RepID=A0ABT9J1Z5_9BACL|nr:substrate-binding domain-containing protein [Chengkuizengella sp. 2205SS18-9]MDP5275633.1 substrate-binding domain-containing protein [Chengkuizengella sp. 2205SS18-9]